MEDHPLTASAHPSILSVGRALPPNYVDQETLISALSAYWGEKHFNVERLADLHRAAQVGGRHLALPLNEYAALDSFARCNDAFLRVATGWPAPGSRRATSRTSSSSRSPGSPRRRSMHGW